MSGGGENWNDNGIHEVDDRLCIARHFVEETEEEQRRSRESMMLFLARRTVLEMLRDRGYSVPDSELQRPLSQFRFDFGINPDFDRLRICAPLVSNPSKKILVIFCGREEIKKQDILGVFSQITERVNLQRVILVLRGRINHYAQKEADNFAIKVEIFKINDLLVNITKHALQPKFEVLSAEEKAKLSEKYKLDNKQYPWMLATDAIARYYGLEKGQVVKITYTGGCADSLITYRCI
ncbi:RNA polymerase, subunit H/Rpb5 C-terminal, partial [Dillenia turbinata]